jgi:ribonuclease D
MSVTAPLGPRAQPEILLESGDVPLEFAQAIRSAGVVAVDLETTGLDPVKDRIGTCQLFVPGWPALVVRPGKAPVILKGILEDPGVQKIFHHASFDVAFLRARLGMMPTHVRCTKIASKILEPAQEDHSLKALLSRHLGIRLEKPAAVRVSNWATEQLSREQLEYAIRDVLHLPALMERLELRLRESGGWELALKAFDTVPVYADLRVATGRNVFDY